MQNRNISIKILEEVVGYFIHHGVMDLDIRFASQANNLEITVAGQTDAKPDDLDYLETLLNAPRKPELEDYYYGLLGTSSNRNELRLLGSLVDWGVTSYQDGQLTIRLRRKD